MNGRIAFLVYTCMVVQDCKHTKNIYKYLFRLGIFALISEIPFDMTFWHMYDPNGASNWNINFLNKCVLHPVPRRCRDCAV